MGALLLGVAAIAPAQAPPTTSNADRLQQGSGSAAAGGGWQLVGVARDEAEARRQVEDVRALDSAVQGTVAQEPDGRWNFRLGPFADKAAAERLSDRLQVEIGMVSLQLVEVAAAAPPRPTGGTNAPAGDAGSDWYVLYHITLDRADADKVKLDLEGIGLFDVRVEQTGSTFRVVSDKFPNRQAADQRKAFAEEEKLPAIGVYGGGLARAQLTQAQQENARRVATELERALRTGGAGATASMRGLSAEELTYIMEAPATGAGLIPNAQPGAAVAAPASAPAATPAPTAAAVVAEDPERVRAMAREAEERGQWQIASDQWRRVRDLAGTDAAIRAEAQEALARIDVQLVRQRPAPGGEGSGNLMYILLGVGAVVVIGGVVFFLKGRRRAAPVPAAIPAALSAATPNPLAPNTPNRMRAAAAATPAPTPPASAPPTGPAVPPTPVAPSTPGGVSLEPVGAQARIRPGVFSPAPDQPAQTGAPAAPAAPEAKTSSHVDIPMFGIADDTEQPAPAAASPSGGDSDRFFQGDETSQIMHTPPAPDIVDRLFGDESSTEVSTGGVIAGGTFFAESFDGIDVGTMPATWRAAGEYQHTALTVENRDDQTGRCLVYRKTAGKESTYFSCRFPEATGQFVVEFDIRCDDKNKYSLGFYIEKDEDFRQSVSTVFHRESSKSEGVSIRLQNEAANYSFGQWRRVRFLVDLPRHIVDAFIDNVPVAMGLRLVARPMSLNTLSIRDNMATEGTMMVDNIRIYKER